jgi:hypothetical protein
MMLPWSRSAAGVACVALCFVIGASPAYAGDMSGAGYLMTVDDLRGDYGPVRDTTSTDLGRTLPSACDPPTSGGSTRGRESMSTPYSEVTFADGVSIQNSVYVYRSPAAARASFELLKSRTLQKCQGQAFSQFGDDEEIVPQVIAAGARRLPAVDGSPRFSVGQSVILLDPQSAPGGYTDFFSYGVLTLAGNAIVQMQTYSDTPISTATRADLRQVNRLVIRRLS